MENLTKEELMKIVTDGSKEKKERKSAALLLIDKYPETKDIRICPDCGRLEEEAKKSYDGLSGDMYYYRYTCPCGKTDTAPEGYSPGMFISISRVAFM